MFCPADSTTTGTGSTRVAPDTPSASEPEEPSAQVDDHRLAPVLLDFFQTRLRRMPERPGRSDLPRLLMRRTLDRLAQEELPLEAERAQPRKERVLRAALIELHQLEAGTASIPADRRH